MCGADKVPSISGALSVGSPPRVRSRQLVGLVVEPQAGITSACAEQTKPNPRSTSRCRDHLRVCGADADKLAANSVNAGSPPRVRSRLGHQRTRRDSPGITSACAEQTRCNAGTATGAGDHLRVCGADDEVRLLDVPGAGSPPRVRSRPPLPGNGHVRDGITSACAEQTVARWTPACPNWDHLRVCGADNITPQPLVPPVGSPPRVRSRRFRFRFRFNRLGITSACAEQTCIGWLEYPAVVDHLRVCGADRYAYGFMNRFSGSPPRVRSRLCSVSPLAFWLGITSACAEQTWSLKRLSSSSRDHLRVCGADLQGDLEQLSGSGSPPRVRSRLPCPCCRSGDGGITSACAEQTLISGVLSGVCGDHLRVCGADTTGVGTATDPSGSPPRVRSRQPCTRL